jgi:homospermidine synthase
METDKTRGLIKYSHFKYTDIHSYVLCKSDLSKEHKRLDDHAIRIVIIDIETTNMKHLLRVFLRKE